MMHTTISETHTLLQQLVIITTQLPPQKETLGDLRNSVLDWGPDGEQKWGKWVEA